MGTNTKHALFALTVSLPLTPKRASAKGLEFWDWQELIPAEHDCHVLLGSLAKFWLDSLPSCRGLLALRWSQVIQPGHRDLKVELFSKDGTQQDTLPTNVAALLGNGTQELIRLLHEYTQCRVVENKDRPIVLGDSQPGDNSAIYSRNAPAIIAAQEILMDDARHDSERPTLTATLTKGGTIDIPASLGKFPFSKTSGRITVEGYFDELSDHRGHGLVKPINGKESYRVRIPRSMRNGAAAAYFRKTCVAVTLGKTNYTIAGFNKSGGYELVDFRVTDDSNAKQSGFQESGKILDQTHIERRKTKNNTHKGPEQRIQADPSKP